MQVEGFNPQTGAQCGYDVPYVALQSGQILGSEALSIGIVFREPFHPFNLTVTEITVMLLYKQRFSF